jgi:hypothetical protein
VATNRSWQRRAADEKRMASGGIHSPFRCTVFATASVRREAVEIPVTASRDQILLAAAA